MYIKYNKLNTNYQLEVDKINTEVVKIGTYIHEKDTYNYLLVKNVHVNKYNSVIANCQRSDSNINTTVTFENGAIAKKINNIENYKKDFNQILQINNEMVNTSAYNMKNMYQFYKFKNVNVHSLIFPENLTVITKDMYWKEKILKTILNLKENI